MSFYVKGGYDLNHLVSTGEKVANSVFLFGIMIPSTLIGLSIASFKYKVRNHPILERRNFELVIFEILGFFKLFVGWH
jgi:hypothetical protein